MSERRPEKREWRFYLEDMVVFARAALSHTQGFDQVRFVGNRLVFDAPCAISN